MGDDGKRRLWMLLLLSIAVGAIVLLAAGLPGLEFPPAQHFFSRSTPPASAGVLGSAEGPESQWLPLVRGILLVAVILFPFSIIYLIVSPQARKRLVRDLSAFATLAAVVYAAVKLRQVLDQLQSSSAGAADPSDLSPLVMPDFSAAPPSWLVYGVSLTLAAVGLALLLGIIGAILHRRQNSADSLEPLAQEAQRTIDALHAGGDLKDTVLRCYAAMSRVVDERRKLTRPVYATAHEFELQLQGAGLPRDQVRRLTRLFDDVRYGARAASEEEQGEAIACLTAIVDACREAAQ
jgi:hypothetical protein